MATHSSTLSWRIPTDRSLSDYSPRGHKKSATTERLSTAQQLPSCVTCCGILKLLEAR